MWKPQTTAWQRFSTFFLGGCLELEDKGVGITHMFVYILLCSVMCMLCARAHVYSWAVCVYACVWFIFICAFCVCGHNHHFAYFSSSMNWPPSTASQATLGCARFVLGLRPGQQLRLALELIFGLKFWLCAGPGWGAGKVQGYYPISIIEIICTTEFYAPPPE